MRPRLYVVGDLVYKRHHIHKKLELAWVGPCVVTKVFSDCLFQVQFKSKSQVLHHDRLKSYRSISIPRWAQKLSKDLRNIPNVQVNSQ